MVVVEVVVVIVVVVVVVAMAVVMDNTLWFEKLINKESLPLTFTAVIGFSQRS